MLLAALPDSARYVGSTWTGGPFGYVSGRSAVRDSRGRLHLVYSKSEPGSPLDSCKPYYTFSDDDGLTWSPVVDICPNGRKPAFPSVLALGPHDEVYCVWFAPNPAAFTFDYWYSAKTDSGWTTPVDISRTQTTSNADANSTVTVGPDGRVHVAYDILMQGQSDICYTAQAGDTWLTPVRVSASLGDDACPTMVADISGTLHLCWRLRGDSGRVMYARRDSAWSVPVQIASAPEAVIDENLAAGADGRVHLVYAGYSTQSSSDIFYTVLDSDTWSTPENISQSGGHIADYSTVATDSVGHVYVAWSQGSGTTQYDLKYRYLTGDWSPVFALTGDSGHSSYGPRLVEVASRRGADIFWPYRVQAEGALSAPLAVYYMKLSPVGQGVAEGARVMHNGVGISAAPNPFSTGVMISSYSDMSVRDVRVYAADGALVRSLAMRPGEVGVKWDGRRADGLDASAGVYTAILTDGAIGGLVRVVKTK